MVKTDKEQYKTPGLLLTVHSKAAFVQNQIKGIAEDPFIGEYAINAVATILESGKSVTYSNPQTGQTSFVVRNLKNQHHLFIPYNEMELQEGDYTILVQVFFYTNDKEKLLGTSQTRQLVIH